MSYLGATADLLQVARTALRERVLEKLDGEGRHDAAMVANAMAIAIRELELGAAVRKRERELLAGFYGTPETALHDLRSRLCGDLRAGDVAEAREPELRKVLEQLAEDRVAISNPGYGRSQG